jgi:hypothetical protein
MRMWARDTVVHVLVDCPKLWDLRQQLWSKIGDVFNNISGMLGVNLKAKQMDVELTGTY